MSPGDAHAGPESGLPGVESQGDQPGYIIAEDPGGQGEPEGTLEREEQSQNTEVRKNEKMRNQNCISQLKGN